ncbi:MAG: hypothetical protein HOK52_06630 [Candidatus Marinimicrobia bacterium]|jgi:GTP cyclohydrolase III|nr:hypothetical protein [Candidatus Neomarinimicrobiota bacterium]
MKATTKIRIIVDYVSFYTTAKEIRQGLGTFDNFNDAARSALNSLETMRNSGGVSPSGLCGKWLGFDIQLDIA